MKKDEVNLKKELDSLHYKGELDSDSQRQLENEIERLNTQLIEQEKAKMSEFDQYKQKLTKAQLKQK